MASSGDTGKNNLILRRQLTGKSTIDQRPISLPDRRSRSRAMNSCRRIAELKKHPVDGFSAGKQYFEPSSTSSALLLRLNAAYSRTFHADRQHSFYLISFKYPVAMSLDRTGG